MTRDELEMLAAPLVERTFAVCQDALAVARLPVTAFDRVILVGGSTRIPLVRRRVEQFFGTSPLDKVNPEEVVAIGAAIQAAALTEVARRRSIPAAPVPGARRSIPSWPSRPMLPSQPPSSPAMPLDRPERDEITVATPVAALYAEAEKEKALSSPAPPRSPVPPRKPGPPPLPGAAPAAPSEPELSPSAVAPVLVDVTPRALVVETVGGWCDVVVQRNAKIPCERIRAFTTSSDMQSVVQVRVAQGEDPTFSQNTYLGQVELSGLRPAPRGQVTIQVRFEVDESGTLKVHATDVSTGNAANATLQLVAVSGPQSVEQMKVRHAGTSVS
jgi:molecular chaperone DnaK